MRGATRASCHQRGAVAGEAGDAVNARGPTGLSDGHGWQDGGESPGQHRLSRPGGAEQKHIWNTTPAFRSALPSRA
jgi:hypothetical protein